MGRGKAKDHSKDRRIKHGACSHPDFGIWAAMIKRCTRPSCKDYYNYGGRGISVCDRWMNPHNFFSDMGPRPDGFELDRIDNDGNYTPTNCRWATRLQQARNKRTTRFMTEEIAARSQVPLSLVTSRLRCGWPVEIATSAPSGSCIIRAKRLTYGGESLPVSEWAKRLGCSPDAIRRRLKVGWSLDLALTEPPGLHYGPRKNQGTPLSPLQVEMDTKKAGCSQVSEVQNGTVGCSTQ